jgi:hypothetical protein
MPRPPSDAKIAEKTGHTVAERIVADTDTGRVLFLDTELTLRMVDNGELVETALEIREPGTKHLAVADPSAVRTFSDASIARFQAAARDIPELVRENGPAIERKSFWKGKRSAQYHDLARHGSIIIWRYGYNNGQNLRSRSVTGPEEEVLWFMRCFAPKKFIATDGWVYPNAGAGINRNYGKESDRVLRSVVGPHWVDYSGRIKKSFGSPEEAQRAFNHWEHKHLSDDWHLFNMELDAAAVRVEG